MSLISSIIRSNIMSVNSSTINRLFRTYRIISGGTVRRYTIINRNQLMSSSNDPLDLRALRGTLCYQLSRIVQLALRHRTRSTSNRHVLLIDIVTQQAHMMPHLLRRAIHSRVLANSIDYSSNFSRILQRINVINRRLLNVLQRTMTTVTRKQIIMIHTST